MPHLPLGMVGLIQVGDDTSNLDEIQGVNLPGQAAGRMALLLENVSAEAATQ